MLVADLDGVFADFTNAACKVHGREGYRVNEWDFFKRWGMTADRFWKVIHDYGDDFYRECVQPYPWAADLIKAVDQADDFVIMSSPSNDPCGYAAKKIWVDKYLQPHLDRKIDLIVGSRKELLAQPDRLLLDDYDVNITNFQKAGGQCCTFPQPWNFQRAMVKTRLSFVSNALRFWSEYKNDLTKPE